MKVLIVGANGKVGKRICKKLATSKHEATAFIRKDTQRSFFEDLGLDVVVESLENSPEQLATVIKGFDAIVFTAGSGGNTGHDKTMEIDLDGAIKVIQVAEKNAIQRFIMVGASHTDDRAYWSKAEGMKPYYLAKHYADKALQQTTLNYTILRPVLLTDEEKEGNVLMTTNPDEVGSEIPRAAVAETVIQILENPKTYGKIIEMSKGNDTIEHAISKIVS